MATSINSFCWGQRIEAAPLKQKNSLGTNVWAVKYYGGTVEHALVWSTIGLLGGCPRYRRFLQ